MLKPGIHFTKSVLVSLLIFISFLSIDHQKAFAQKSITGGMADGIAGSKRVVLNSSGHLPHIEVPDIFNRLVLDFLNTVK